MKAVRQLGPDQRASGARSEGLGDDCNTFALRELESALLCAEE